MRKPFTIVDLPAKFEEAKKGMFIIKGMVTLDSYESCTMYCGDITLKDGRPAQVHLTVQADVDEFMEG